ncbi:MAG: hypothetical protein ACC655_01375 [Rhodothermia bacterium]
MSFSAVACLTMATGLLAQIASFEAGEPTGGLRNPALARYDVIVLLVEFQPDSSRFSTGDGTFSEDLFQGLQPRIDPFPHDEAYFRAHFDFLEAYVDDVSHGATRVKTHLLPEVVRVSGTMAEYSPIGPDSDSPGEIGKLAELVAEAWGLADENTALRPPAGLDPQSTAFMLAHAGTGRDIELTGTVLDRTPEDLPSIFFDEQALDQLLGRPVFFDGMKVTSTVIIPETESKRGVEPISGEAFLLELSINGLIAASFLNFLGVPDLFDTSTGQSAIGPFGLMDPLGIFAYAGLLPPEPSGWTKHFLGWSIPVRPSAGEPGSVELIELRAGIDVALAPVSSSEYFLAEVRHRDLEGDGLNLVVYVDGQRVEQRFDHDSDDFNAIDQSGFEGVLVSADDYDWALPGGFDSSGDLRLGGILIWHVDENRFRKGLADNSVNADPARRALDLEEADSAQDLGHPSTSLFAPDFDRGTPFDFYFEGNPITTITETGQVTLYENRFAAGTWPNSDSNAGGPSFVALGDFSPVSTTMSLTYSREANPWTRPIGSLSGSRLLGQTGPGGSISLVSTNRGPAVIPTLFVHAGREPGAWLVSLASGRTEELRGVITKPAVVRTSGASLSVSFLVEDDDGQVWFTRIPPGQGPPQVRYPMPEDVRFRRPETPLIAIKDGDAPEYFVGYDLDGAGAVVRISSSGETKLIPTNTAVRSLVGIDNKQIAIVEDTRTSIYNASGDASGAVTEWTYPPLQGEVGQAVFGFDVSGLVGVIPLSDSDRFILLDADGQSHEWSTFSGRMSVAPVLADLDLDGFLDLIYTSGARLEAMTRAGAVVNGFPISMPDSSSGQPLVAVWEGERRPSVLVGLGDGYLHAYSVEDGKERPGFPLAVGGGGLTTPLLADSALFAVSADGKVGGWVISGVGEVEWGQLYANPANTSYIASSGQPPQEPETSSLIDEQETYNWPNPVNDGTTRIRVKTREQSDIRMTVIDLSGTLVFESLLGVSPPGVPTEFEWRPEVGSGVYYARIEATATNGESATKLIRIAVIR